VDGGAAGGGVQEEAGGAAQPVREGAESAREQGDAQQGQQGQVEREFHVRTTTGSAKGARKGRQRAGVQV